MGGCGKAITTLAGNRTDDNFIIDEQDNIRTIQKRNLNDVVNCIHTNAGSGYKTMEILIVEVEDEQV